VSTPSSLVEGNGLLTPARMIPDLMEEFYGKWLEEEDIHDAFRDAQIELRKNYPHPFYWGAFVLLGN